MGRLAAYSAARGARISYVKSAGVEVARHNVQVNLIAQNWVENPAYYPPEMQANPKFRKNLKDQVPIGRLARPEEDIAFALFMASDQSDFFVGQAICRRLNKLAQVAPDFMRRFPLLAKPDRVRCSHR